MTALRSFDRISDVSKPLKDERRGHILPHELVRQSEAKRKQAPQSEANVCRRRRHKCKKTSVINCTGHPTMHSTPNTLGVAFSYLKRNYALRLFRNWPEMNFDTSKLKRKQRRFHGSDSLQGVLNRS